MQQSESNVSAFLLSRCLKVGHAIKSQSFITTLIKAYLFWNVVAIFLDSLYSTFEQKHAYSLLAQDVFQWLIFGVKVSSQAFFKYQRDDPQILWTRQHCLSKVCDNLCVAPSFVTKNQTYRFFVGQTRRRQAYILPSVSAVTGIIANMVPVNSGFQSGFLT